MASALPVIKLGPAAAGAVEGSLVHANLPVVGEHKFVPAGAMFLRHMHRRERQISYSNAATLAAEAADDGDDDLSPIDDGSDNLKGIDAAEWRKQDHYRLLGLAHLRWKATDDDIRKAYKKQVLRHHPDKKSTGQTTEEERSQNDAFFTCIKKAFEILTNEENRVLFDSVDEYSGIDESVPAVLKEDKAHKFYETFGPVLENNSRFLENRDKLPPFGDDSTPYAEVEAYYAFWYNTPSWRAFGYFDEENPDKAEDRDEKRYLLKKNKAARKKAKTEDNMRMQRLVDNAYASDPRIRRYKQGIRDAKAAAAAAKAQEKEAAERAVKEAAKAAEEAKAAAALAEKEGSKAANERGRNVRRAFTKTCKRADLVADGVCTEDDIESLRSSRPIDEIEELATYAKDALVAAIKTLLANPTGPRLPSQKPASS